MTRPPGGHTLRPIVWAAACTLCHDLKRIRRGRRSAEAWEETLNSILNEDAGHFGFN